LIEIRAARRDPGLPASMSQWMNMPPETAEEAMSEVEGEAAPAAAFVGRVLAAFVTLVVLMAFVLAMVGLAYWSKHDAPALRSPPPPAPAASTLPSSLLR
jgi:hypothetical protein